MRRRVPRAPAGGPVPVELVDSARWPLCPRWDGGSQPCVCWANEAQRNWVDAGNEWPGGEVGFFSDFLEQSIKHWCKQPFDWSVI